VTERDGVVEVAGAYEGGRGEGEEGDVRGIRCGGAGVTAGDRVVEVAGAYVGGGGVSGGLVTSLQRSRRRDRRNGSGPSGERQRVGEDSGRQAD
jgi:hypothetical protein